MTSLAGESQKIFMVAIPALHPGKAVVQLATFQVAVNDLLEIGPAEPERPFKPLFVDLKKGLIFGQVSRSGAIYSRINHELHGNMHNLKD